MLIRAHFSDGMPAPRYGIALRFETPDDGDPHRARVGGHHSSLRSSTIAVVTNSEGTATSNRPRSELKEVFRVTKASAGSFGFHSAVCGDTVDVTVTSWPSPIAELRETLQGPVGDAMRQMADTVLSDSREQMSKLFDPKKVDAWTADDGDNPHIRVGALLTALSISCLHARSDADIAATLEGISGLVSWLEHRKHPSEPGYLLRWKQKNLDSRADQDWKAEPSLDEYSGLLMGLSWLRDLSPAIRQMPPNLKLRAEDLWSGIGKYLARTDGWLVRPGAGDLTARGPDLAASAWILGRLFDGFHNEHPLRLSNETKAVFERSKLYLATCDLDDEFKRAYKGTIAMADALLKAQEAQRALAIADLALDLLAFAGMAVCPVASSLLFMLGGATNAINDLYNEKVLNADALNLWRLFGTALGSPYSVDGGGFNAEIFDRNVLAAFPTGNAAMRFATGPRYSRPLAADRDGVRILTLAGRYCFSETGVMDDLADVLKAEVAHFRAMSSVPIKSEAVEGFVLGWCLLCHLADLDPGIDWARYVKGERMESKAAQDSRIFDWKWYVGHYGDLPNHGIDDEQTARNHWLTYGVKEGRQGHPAFHTVQYVAMYGDLQNAFGDDRWAALVHYFNHGIAERRVGVYALDGRIFDWQWYVAHYGDLRSHGINDEQAARTHWLSYGVNEGRQGHPTFHTVQYVARYEDLQRAYGHNPWAAIEHYFRHGIAEGRVGV